MSQAIEKSVNLNKSASETWLNWDSLLLGLPLLGISPLLFLEFSQMWAKPHLQYFPISILAFGWLVWQELPKPRVYAEGLRHRISMVLFGMSIAVGLAALWLYSPLLGLLAAIVAVSAWSFKALVHSSIPRILSLLAIVASCIPLPLNYDQVLVGELQELASRTCSYALDGLDVPHLLEGNIVQIADHPLFVEEACSGVTSLYSLLSLGIIFAVVNKRSLFVALGTIVFIPILAITTNLLRLLSIVLALEWWDIDLAHGFIHTVLGLVVFSISAIALFCLDRTLATLFAPIPDDRSKAAILLSGYNNLVRWPYAYRGQRSTAVKTNAIGSDPVTSEVSAAPVPAEPIPSWLRTVSPVVFLLMLAISVTFMLYLGLNSPVVFAEPNISDELAAQFPMEKALPEKLGGNWERIGFRVEKRDRESMYGQRSHFWQYRNSEGVLILSLDFPFRAWHPLDHCYSKSGWTIESIEMVANPENEHWPWLQVEMTNGLGLRGLLYYCHFDEQGKPYLAKDMEATAMESRARVNAFQMLSASKDLREPITYQFQLFVESPKTLNADEEKNLREVFLTARELIRQSSLDVISKVSE